MSHRSAGRRVLVILATTCAVACLGAQQPSAPHFEGRRALEDIRQLVGIGTRVAGTPGAQAARDYIRNQLQAAGVAVQEQPFDATTPAGRVKMINLRATLPAGGSSQPAGRLVIGGHYDTKRFTNFTFVGANDGGSSAAFLIELARALKGRTNRVPIELLFLDGEEAVGEWEGTDHTYGSRYYVDAARRDGTLNDIRAFILVDMIGDRDLVVKREPGSTAALTDIIWSAAGRLNERRFVNEPFPVEDDHLEFLAAGVPAVDIIDLEYYTRSGEMAWHSQYDTLENVAAESLQAVGDVLIAALPALEAVNARHAR